MKISGEKHRETRTDNVVENQKPILVGAKLPEKCRHINAQSLMGARGQRQKEKAK